MNRNVVAIGILALVLGPMMLSDTSAQIVQNSSMAQVEESTGITFATTTELDYEIVDISFRGTRIIATIRNTGNESLKTVTIRFFRSRIVGGNPTNPVHLGDRLTSIPVGETRDVSIGWIGFGHYLIHVEVVGFDIAAQEVWWFLFFGWEV